MINSRRTVLVLFHKANDPTCRKALMIVTSIEKKYHEKDLFLCTLDVEDHVEPSLQYRVSIVPTVIVFQGGFKIYERICLPDIVELDNFLCTLNLNER